jgi:acyl-CoA synthetase (AMP-forming)/AMP-acid ligase II
MSKIHLPGYDTEPTLPRSSVFEYLFPNPTSRPSYPCPDVSDVAYIDGLTGREITRGEVADQAKRLAAGLRSLGLKRGDVGCVYGMNSLEWVNAAMGCQAAGIVVSPANYG